MNAVITDPLAAKFYESERPGDKLFFNKDACRQRAWDCAIKAIQSLKLEDRQKLLGCAKKVFDFEEGTHVFKLFDTQGIQENPRLTSVEKSTMGYVCTRGALTQRKRFWKFILYASFGVQPKGLVTKLAN